MPENWYIVYTKAKCERRVAAHLTKRKIENFCPLNRREIYQIRSSKWIYEPLFASFVFVHINEHEINKLTRISKVLNVVYWKSRPAIIQQEEVEVIREFISDHQNIKLERSAIDYNSKPSVVDRPAHVINGNVVRVKNSFIKVNLPTLGFTMVAEVEGKGVMGREIVVSKMETQLKS